MFCKINISRYSITFINDNNLTMQWCSRFLFLLIDGSKISTTLQCIGDNSTSAIFAAICISVLNPLCRLGRNSSFQFSVSVLHAVLNSLLWFQLILVQSHWKAATRGKWVLRDAYIAVSWWREWLDTYLVKLFPPLHQSASFPQCASAAAPAFVVASLFNPIIAPDWQTQMSGTNKHHN